MAQFARPDSDITTSVWTTTPLWSKLDDNDDADFVSSAAPPASAEEFEVGLSDLNTPGAGDVIFRVRIWEVSDTSNTAAINLYQGATLIRALNLSTTAITATAATYTATLTTGERDSITDWTDLRFRVSANRTGGVNRSVRVGWLELETPDAASGTNAPAENVTLTATSHDAQGAVAPSATEATLTVAAHDPTTQVAPETTDAAATATAHDATISTSANAEAATATAAAHDATVSIGASATEATATATADDPSAAIAVIAEAVAIVAAAHNATIDVPVSPGRMALTTAKAGMVLTTTHPGMTLTDQRTGSMTLTAT